MCAVCLVKDNGYRLVYKHTHTFDTYTYMNKKLLNRYKSTFFGAISGFSPLQSKCKPISHVRAALMDMNCVRTYVMLLL